MGGLKIRHVKGKLKIIMNVNVMLNDDESTMETVISCLIEDLGYEIGYARLEKAEIIEQKISDVK